MKLSITEKSILKDWSNVNIRMNDSSLLSEIKNIVDPIPFGNGVDICCNKKCLE